MPACLGERNGNEVIRRGSVLEEEAIAGPVGVKVGAATAAVAYNGGVHKVGRCEVGRLSKPFPGLGIQN